MNQYTKGFSEEEIDKLVELNQSGLTPKEISSYFPGRTYESISKKLVKLNLKVKPKVYDVLNKVEDMNTYKLKREQRANKSYKRQISILEERLLTEEDFVERTKECMARIEPLKPYKRIDYKTQYEPQSLVVLFSDAQIGEKIDLKETQLGEYNIEIFKKRVENYYGSIMRIVDRYRKTTPINDANIFFLGDMVEGEKIYRGQGARITDDLMTQFFKGKDIVSKFISEMSANFEKVNCHCIAGNHGRAVGEKKDEAKFYVNWDYLMYNYMRDTLKEHKNLEWNIPMSWWTIAQVQNDKFFLTHGDDLMRYMGIPWYSMERMDNRESKMLQMVGKDYNHMVVGHHHQAIMWDGGPGERIVNGSFSSANYYAAKKMNLMTHPKQIIFGVHPDKGISFRYIIDLNKEN